MKEVLSEIIFSPKFTLFLIDNEAIRAEIRIKEKAEKERKMLEGRTDSFVEDEDYVSNEKLIRFKRARNTTCFGQRTINTIKQYYHSVNEMLLIKDEICESMFNIDKEAFELGIEIEKNNELQENKFILINPKKKGSKGNVFYTEENEKFYKYKNSNFMSMDNYHKFIKNLNNERILSMQKTQTDLTQYQMLLQTLNQKKFVGRNKKKTLPFLLSPSEIKTQATTTEKKIQKVKKKILPSIITLNKDIQYQINKGKNKIKKDLIPIRTKEIAYVLDFNYDVLFNSYKHF